jgi:glycogen debranching enzyme
VIAASPGSRGTDPVLLTSLASAALLDGRGDLEMMREMRGTSVEWGGVMGQCIRLTGAWRLSLRVGDAVASLPGTRVESGPAPGGWSSRHSWNGIEIAQAVGAVAQLPGVVRTVRCSTTGPGPVELRLRSTFRPVLCPVLVEGIQPHRFEVVRSPDEVRVRQRAFALAVRSNVPPVASFVNGDPWTGERIEGRVEEVGAEYGLRIAPDSPADLTELAYGGLTRDLDAWVGPARAVLADPAGAMRAVEADDRAWADRTPRLSFPDAPELERGYALARDALRRLYAAPGDGMTGLVAGYPWYSAIWCRDLAWMLNAVAWLGDLDWMRRSIDTVLRFQGRAPIPILAGETGELPMQVSPGPIFFYGTSDTTLYYPLLMERWRHHTGAVEMPEGWNDAVERIVAWGEARTDPDSGLLRNGGEAEEIGATPGNLARVQYGIDAPDTTIWDSADRREHAIDVQVLWWQSLAAAAGLTAESTAPATRARWAALADRVAQSVRSKYPWEEQGYLFDSLRDGRGVTQLRPNALRTVSAGLVDGALAKQLVVRAAQDDLRAPWGVRTLSSRDPTYDPTAYHEGQVWTIATAWLADAALAAGEPALGAEVLGQIARLLATEGMGANECYRGDRPEPFDSCFLLGFSVAPFLTTLFARLWGLTLDARAGTLSVRPRFPEGWRSARLERLRFGDGSVDLDWTPDRLRVRWSGPGALSVETAAPPVQVAPGAVTDLPTHGPREPS